MATEDALGNKISTLADRPAHGMPEQAELPSGMMESKLQRSATTAPELDEREKMLGKLYMSQDGETFRAEVKDYQRRNPNLAPTDAMRGAINRREQFDKANSPEAREINLRLQQPGQLELAKRRVLAGLPMFPEESKF
jgi:hypothetical protein